MISRFTISARIGFAMALLGFLLIGIGAFGMIGMRVSNDANRKTYAVQMPKSVAVGEMMLLVGRQRSGREAPLVFRGNHAYVFDPLNIRLGENEA